MHPPFRIKFVHTKTNLYKLKENLKHVGWFQNLPNSHYAYAKFTQYIIQNILF